MLALLSGMGSVVYEVLYLRALTTLMGDMYYVHAAILTVFMAGMGIGALCAEKIRKWLFGVEILTGLYAVSFPVIIRIFVQSPLSRVVHNPVINTFIVSILFMMLPAFCMGVSIPLFSLYLQKQNQQPDAFKNVYAVYNLGAAGCIILVEFIILRKWGIALTLQGVGALNIICGMVLYLKGLYGKNVVDIPVEESKGRLPFTIWPAIFLASLSAALFNAFFVMLSYYLLMPNRENFALCTAAILVGMSAGTWGIKKYRISFENCLFYSVLVLAGIYAFYLPFQSMVRTLLSVMTVPWSRFLVKALAVLLLGGIPFVMIGAVLPAILLEEHLIARRAGRLLFVSGLANALGVILYMFLIHPGIKFFLTLPLCAFLFFIAIAICKKKKTVFRHQKTQLVFGVHITFDYFAWNF